MPAATASRTDEPHIEATAYPAANASPAPVVSATPSIDGTPTSYGPSDDGSPATVTGSGPRFTMDTFTRSCGTNADSGSLAKTTSGARSSSKTANRSAPKASITATDDVSMLTLAPTSRAPAMSTLAAVPIGSDNSE